MANVQKGPDVLCAASEFYAGYAKKVSRVKAVLGRPMTFAEKVLYAHLYKDSDLATTRGFSRGETYVNFRPDRVAMQDATAQMALLQFINANRVKVAVPTTVHCDHLIKADQGALTDLPKAVADNKEVYEFLREASSRFGIGFWEPGAGIIHQVVLENYAFPGGMMVGTDSHTPNAGGLGMIAIGVGGADAVDVMTGTEWELKMPKIIGVRLTGRLSGWASPKDIILKLAGILTVKGGTNSILEYFGDGAGTLSATGKATICNMGAEVGATTSIFPYDGEMRKYLQATGREKIAAMADGVSACLRADDEVNDNPEIYYDRIIDIDLREVEPYVNGPFSPDAATPLSEFAQKVVENGYPRKMEVGLVGSCTNSSYQDLSRAASIARQAVEKHIPSAAPLIVNPGSEKIRATIERDELLKNFTELGATVMANACGPCIGQWNRHTDDPLRRNSIVTSFNRNFAKRADGNPNTFAFVASPEIVVALSIAGDLCFNPLKDVLIDAEGNGKKLNPPEGDELPGQGFRAGAEGYVEPDGVQREIKVNPQSNRLQLLKPFPAWNGEDLKDMPLLIKVKGKCTTDHISMAGPWLRFRGHLENISDNMLIGAVNAFTGETGKVWSLSEGGYCGVSQTAKKYKQTGISSIVVAEENYGEGSSREHAAMEPRFLNVKVILAKSFARIHETNLKKQGMLALTFKDKADYDKIQEQDRISVSGLKQFAPGSEMTVTLFHEDGTTDTFKAVHTYNEQQIEWFKAGSALNFNSNKAL